MKEVSGTLMSPKYFKINVSIVMTTKARWGFMYTVKCVWMENMNVHTHICIIQPPFVSLSEYWASDVMCKYLSLIQKTWWSQLIKWTQTYTMQISCQKRHSKKQMLIKWATPPKVIEMSIRVCFVSTMFGVLH